MLRDRIKVQTLSCAALDRRHSFRERVRTSTPSQIFRYGGRSQRVRVIGSECKEDALTFARHGEFFVAQAARKGRTEVSTKHLNSAELTAIRQAKQLRRRGGIEETEFHQKFDANALGIDEEIGRTLKRADCPPRVHGPSSGSPATKSRPRRAGGLAMFSFVWRRVHTRMCARET